MDPLTQFSLWAQLVIQSWGYLGIFIVSFLGNATIILPVPSFLAVFAAGSLLNPWLVGLVAGFGAALGELTGYVLGVGGRRALQARYDKDIAKVKKVMEKYGMFSILVLFAATPLPDDIVGILAGVIRYDIRRFFLASFLGKSILHIGIAWAGFYGSFLLGGWLPIFNLVIAVFLGLVIFYMFKALTDWRKGRLLKGHHGNRKRK